MPDIDPATDLELAVQDFVGTVVRTYLVGMSCADAAGLLRAAARQLEKIHDH